MPALVQSHAVVALVTATGNERWAADAAWAVARAAATAGRRVALVDLMLEDPRLHAAAGVAPGAAGIADAFERGAELTALAHEVAGVYFLSSGTPTAAPEFVLAHPRWKKLHAGFHAEGALLLLYLSAGALGRLSVVPDGIIVLAPEGFDLDAPHGREVGAAQVDGAQLLGVVRDRWTPPPQPIPAAALTTPAPQPRRARRRTMAGGAVLLLVAGAVAVALIVRRGESAPPTPVAATPPAPTPVPVAAPVDTLGWVLQLASYASMENALAHAEALAAVDLLPFVSPVATGTSGAVWYRVLVGGWVEREAAMSQRDSLWARGVVPHGEGDVVRAPLSLELEGAVDITALRVRGIPALARPDGRALVGAFETPEQAGYMQDQLIAAGVPAELVSRVERHR